MKNKDVEEFTGIAKETKEALCEGVNDFFEQTRQGCHDFNSFITMDKLEEISLDMMTRSQASCVDMISRMLSAVDETKLLELKKGSTRKRESH